MRGDDAIPTATWSYIPVDDRIPQDHPLRPIRSMVDAALRELSPRFDDLYSREGRPSIAPEKLLRALLLQLLYTVRSERMLMEQLDYNILFRWFVGLNIDDPIWNVTVFTKNRERLLRGDIARAFFTEIVAQAKAAHLLSDEHFTVDGTLIEAWASHKSIQPKDKDEVPPPSTGGRKNPDVDFRGTKRTNDTHASVTDPDARLYRKSENAPAKLGYLGHTLIENRNGLIVDAHVNFADGWGERTAAAVMLARLEPGYPRSLGADKGYDSREFITFLTRMNITPHIAQNTKRQGGTAVPDAIAQTEEYAVSQRCRKKVEEGFGWMKVIGSMRKVKHRGRKLIGWMFELNAAAFNLVCMRTLLAT